VTVKAGKRFWGQHRNAVSIFEAWTVFGRQYRVVIKQYPAKPREYKRIGVNIHRTWVHCSCPNFLYVWEYALAQHGGSDIISGNGNPPTTTNPSLIPGVCKHVVACVTASKSQPAFPAYPLKGMKGGLDEDLVAAYDAVSAELKKAGMPGPELLRPFSQRDTEANIKREALKLDSFLAGIKPQQLAALSLLFGDEDDSGHKIGGNS
jgi:hypothetical protein